MSTFRIRSYQYHDETALLSIWNAALPFDQIDQRTFQRKVLLDPNFDPDWLIVAEVEADSQPIGFCLCLIRRVSMEKVGLEPKKGWITAMGVHPAWCHQGVGSALLDRALQLFRSADRSEVFISPYTPSYFVPGVDVDHYSEGLKFLQNRGFEIISRPLSMDANIVLFNYEAWIDREAMLRDQKIEVRPMQAYEIPELLEFLKAQMPGDWVRHARELLTDIAKGLGSYDQFMIAVQNDKVVGYCQFEGEHFGPFGVQDDMQGRGIGTALMAKCLLVMRQKGLHHAWVLWTSDEAAERIYKRFGFRETRRFAILKKSLVREWVAEKAREQLADREKDPLWKLVGIVPDAPPDMAENHDQYLYGIKIGAKSAPRKRRK